MGPCCQTTNAKNAKQLADKQANMQKKPKSEGQADGNNNEQDLANNPVMNRNFNGSSFGKSGPLQASNSMV